MTIAFQLGYAAANETEPKCPYRDGTNEAKDWHRGFDEASYVIKLRREFAK